MKLGWFLPILQFSASISFFISPLLSGMTTVSHNAGQRELGCSWAECWKGCAITPAPLLRALQRWRDWEVEWWAFNTKHNRAPQPQTGTIFTLSWGSPWALWQSRRNDHPSSCSQGSIIHEKRWMGCKQGMLTEGGGAPPEECVLSPVCLSN